MYLPRKVPTVAFLFGAWLTFHVNGTGTNTLRLNFAKASPNLIAEGVKRLAAVLNGTPRSWPNSAFLQSRVGFKKFLQPLPDRHQVRSNALEAIFRYPLLDHPQ